MAAEPSSRAVSSPANPRSRPGLTLAEAAPHVRPLVLASERVLVVPGPLGDLLPGGGLRRGSVVCLEGGMGAGRTSLLLALAAAATTVGEWAAVVVPEGPTTAARGDLGAPAAAEAGVAVERLALVRGVPAAQWATVVAALVDGVAVVVPDGLPRGVSPALLRRLTARVREQGAVLVVPGPWPGAALTLRPLGFTWRRLGDDGHLTGRRLQVEVEVRGGSPRPAILRATG